MDTFNANQAAAIASPEDDRDNVLFAFARSLSTPSPDGEGPDDEERREAFLKLARAL